MFTVPPGRNGRYFFNAYVFTQTEEFGRFDMVVNDEMVCTMAGDHQNLNDHAAASCSAVVDAVEGVSFSLVLHGA